MSRTPVREATQERIIDAARRLMQRRGYHGVGTAAILAEADAPKGSMYHHFPEGKERIAAEAVTRIRDDVLRALDDTARKGTPVDVLVRKLARSMARWLRATDFRESTMLASVAPGADPALPMLQGALHDALAAWRAALTTLLIREGLTKLRARQLAQTILAALEGAMMTARLERDAAVVLVVAAQVAHLIAFARDSAERC
jgi:TetR/AcrR family transcriptional regulator, lmrAB and yxaGH operons repressor